MSGRELMVGGRPLSTLRVVDLKEELEKRGLSKSGSKKDLAERLRLHLQIEKHREGASTDEEQLPNISMHEQLAEQNPFIRDYFASQAELFHSQKVVKKLYEEEVRRESEASSASADEGGESPVKEKKIVSSSERGKVRKLVQHFETQSKDESEDLEKSVGLSRSEETQESEDSETRAPVEVEQPDRRVTRGRSTEVLKPSSQKDKSIELVKTSEENSPEVESQQKLTEESDIMQLKKSNEESKVSKDVEPENLIKNEPAVTVPDKDSKETSEPPILAKKTTEPRKLIVYSDKDSAVLSKSTASPLEKALEKLQKSPSNKREEPLTTKIQEKDKKASSKTEDNSIVATKHDESKKDDKIGLELEVGKLVQHLETQPTNKTEDLDKSVEIARSEKKQKSGDSEIASVGVGQPEKRTTRGRSTEVFKQSPHKDKSIQLTKPSKESSQDSEPQELPTKSKQSSSKVEPLEIVKKLKESNPKLEPQELVKKLKDSNSKVEPQDLVKKPKDSNPQVEQQELVKQPKDSNLKVEPKELVKKSKESNPKVEPQELLKKSMESDPKVEPQELLKKSKETDPKVESQELPKKSRESDPKLEPQEVLKKSKESNSKVEQQELHKKSRESSSKVEPQELHKKSRESSSKAEPQELHKKSRESSSKVEPREVVKKMKEHSSEEPREVVKKMKEHSSEEPREVVKKIKEHSSEEPREVVKKMKEHSSEEPHKKSPEKSTIVQLKKSNEEIKVPKDTESEKLIKIVSAEILSGKGSKLAGDPPVMAKKTPEPKKLIVFSDKEPVVTSKLVVSPLEKALEKLQKTLSSRKEDHVTKKIPEKDKQKSGKIEDNSALTTELDESEKAELELHANTTEIDIDEEPKSAVPTVTVKPTKVLITGPVTVSVQSDRGRKITLSRDRFHPEKKVKRTKSNSSSSRSSSRSRSPGVRGRRVASVRTEGMEDEALDYGDEEKCKSEPVKYTWSRRILRMKNKHVIPSKEKKWQKEGDKRSSLLITSEILEQYYPEVKPVPVSELKLDEKDPPRIERKVEIVRKISLVTEAPPPPGTNLESMSVKRKISIVPIIEDGDKELTPPRNPPSQLIMVTNLVRPFTLPQLKELLQRTGNIVDIWVDKIKSKCIAKFEKEEEAFETRAALHGVKWPASNSKSLLVDYSTQDNLDGQRAKESGDVKVKVEKPQMAQTQPVREWDMGKRSRSRSPNRVRRRSRSNSRDRKRTRRSPSLHKRRHSRSPHQDRRGRGVEIKEAEPLGKALDELFRKTVATPSIYWLPLTPQQIAEKEDLRRRRMLERERRLAELSKLRPR